MPLGVGHLNLVIDPHNKVLTFVRPMWDGAEVIFLPYWWSSGIRRYNCVEYSHIRDLPDLTARHDHPVVFVDGRELDVQHFLSPFYHPDVPYPELDETAVLLRELPGTVYVYLAHKSYSIAKVTRCFDRIYRRRLPSHTEAQCEVLWDSSMPPSKYDTPILL